MMLTTDLEQLNYTQTGEGEALCLLHGFLENKNIWNPFLESLSQKYKVFAFDLPGHGNSALLKGGNTMLEMAQAVRAVLKNEGVDKIKLIGHSMGGYVALAYAESFPAEVEGVLLLNSTPEADTAERKELRKHGIAVAQKNYEALVSMSVANLFSQTLREQFNKQIERTKAEALLTPKESYIVCQEAMAMRPDLSDFWKDSKIKKKMILGSDDTLIEANRLSKLFETENVEIVILEGGHMLHIENTQNLLTNIINF